MPAELQARKPRPKPAPYARNAEAKSQPNAPATPAKSTSRNKCRENLTLRDWLTVFAFIDSHPHTPQERVVEHFKTLQEGPLVFTQSTLSRKLKDRAELEQRVNSHPNALSGKRPRVVTSPEVENALVLWVRSMEEKGETVSWPMLREKRKQFEQEFGVPEERRLAGDGWIASFCRTYKIKEYRRHDEGGSESVDIGVAAERAYFQNLSPPKDHFDFGDPGLFAFNAPPLIRDFKRQSRRVAKKKTGPASHSISLQIPQWQLNRVI